MQRSLDQQKKQAVCVDQPHFPGHPAPGRLFWDRPLPCLIVKGKRNKRKEEKPTILPLTRKETWKIGKHLALSLLDVCCGNNLFVFNEK